MQYTNSEIERKISEQIHSDRDRKLLRRRLIDGKTYDELSAEFYLSRRQVARIIAKAKRTLTNEQQPEWHEKGTPATLRGCLFLFYNGTRRRGAGMFDYTGNPYNPTMNPYLAAAAQHNYSQQAPRQEVVRVNGENGARAYPIGPNSSALLLDESGKLVWLITSDGAGYKSVAPFDIAPHETAPAPDYSSLESRIARLEEMMNNAASTADTAIIKQEPEHRADQTGRR